MDDLDGGELSDIDIWYDLSQGPDFYAVQGLIAIS